MMIDAVLFALALAERFKEALNKCHFEQEREIYCIDYLKIPHCVRNDIRELFRVSLMAKALMQT